MENIYRWKSCVVLLLFARHTSAGPGGLQPRNSEKIPGPKLAVLS